jgi:hypothetical protein
VEITPYAGPYTGPKLITAAAVARDRLEKYIAEKLAAANSDDESAWLLYTFLLEKAKSYRIDYSGYVSPAHKEDEAAALENRKNLKKENVSSPPSDNSPRGEQR